MDPEKYKRAIEINKKIEDLQEVLRKIRSRGAWLNFSYKDAVNSHEGFVDWEILPIKNILQTHECMVISDINRAIEELEKEIKEL